MLHHFVTFLDKHKSKSRKQREQYILAATDAEQQSLSKDIDLF